MIGVWLRGTARVCAVGALTMALGVACTGDDGTTSLRVTVSGLPDDVDARVELTGPGGSAEPITGTVDLGEVDPGTYGLDIDPVRVAGADAPPEVGPATWHPGEDHLTVTVDEHEAAEAVVDYTTLVPDTTRSVDAAASGLVRPAGTGSTLVFDRDAQVLDSLRSGDVLVGGIGPMTPRGLLRKVLAVRRAGDVVEVETRPASLPEAAPIAEFHVEAPLTLPRGGARGAAASGSGPLTYQVPLGSDQGMCKGSGELSASFRLTLEQPDLTFDPAWGGDERHVRLAITFPQSAAVSVSGSGSVSCTGSASSPRISLTPILVSAEPPIWVTPQVDFPGELSASVKVGATFDVKQAASLTVGGEYVNGEPSSFADPSNEFDLNAKPTGEFTMAAKGGIRIRFLVDQTVGPAFTLSVGVNGTVDPVTPKYELKAGLYGDLSMDVSLFGYQDIASVSWPDLIKAETVLWSLGQPGDPNGGGGGPTGSGGSTCPTVAAIESAPGYLVPPETTLNPLPDCYGGYALATAITATGIVYAVLLRDDRLGWTAAVTDGDVCDLGMMRQAPSDVRQHYGCGSAEDACGTIYDRVWESEATVAVTEGTAGCTEAMRVMRAYLGSTTSYDRYFRTDVEGWSCWDRGAQHPAELVCERGSEEIAVTSWSRRD